MKKGRVIVMASALLFGSLLLHSAIKEKDPNLIFDEWKSEIQSVYLRATEAKVERDCPQLFNALKQVIAQKKWDKSSWDLWRATLKKWKISSNEIKEELLSWAQLPKLVWLLYKRSASEQAIFGLGAALQIKFEDQIKQWS